MSFIAYVKDQDLNHVTTVDIQDEDEISSLKHLAVALKLSAASLGIIQKMKVANAIRTQLYNLGYVVVLKKASSLHALI